MSSSHKTNSSIIPTSYTPVSSTPSLSGNSLVGGSGLIDRSRVVYGSPSSGSTAVASSSSLKEEYEERQKLEKNNFELKMKIYYLEESLKRYQDGEQSNDLQSVNHQIEIEKLKRQLEDKHIDLEQRNLLLMKSKNAIEALKIEVDRLRQDNEHAHDLEDRVRKLNQLNKDVENTYLEKISDMEFQLLSQRKVIENKDKERSTIEERLNNTDVSYQHLENKIRLLQDDKISISEQLVLSQHRVSKLEGELTQAITHGDLNRIQLEECKSERDVVKEKLKQEQLMKLKIEEEYTERLNAMSKQSDTQLRLLRSVHEDDVEKMRKGHLEMLNDVKDSYHAEMTRLKSEFDRNMNDVKRSDAIDHDRTVTSYNSRMDEKNEEIKSLRSMLGSETQRSNTILQELETTRNDLKLKIQHIDNLAVESNMKSDELKVIPRLASEIDEWKRKYALVQDQYKHENAEKIQVCSRLEQTTTLLESNRNTLKETDQSLQSAHHEISRLNKELVDQTSRADTVELISRENERLKNNIAQLETEIISMNHKASELKREIERMADENGKLCIERESLKESLKGLSNKIDALQEQIDAYHIQNQNEKERRSASEAALNETRNVVLQSRDEVQNERNQKLALEKKVGMVEDELRDMRKCIGSACVMSYQAMLKWDEMMSGILDGELFVGMMMPSRSLTGKLGLNRLSSSSSSVINSSSNSRGVNMNVLLNNTNTTTNSNNNQNSNYHHDNNSTDLLDLSHDQLMQRVAISIERVDLKVHRTQKIRSLFLTQTEALITAVQDNIHNTHEKVSLYNHKLTDSQMHLQKIKDTIHKDIKQRDDEMLEIKQFKEVVLTQHSAQLRDSELRYAQLTQQLQHEKQRSIDLQSQVTSQIDELRVLQQTNQKLHDELQVFERTEQIVSELSDRVTDLGETNRSLIKELEVKSTTISQLTYDYNEIFSQHDSLQTKYELLMNKIRMKEESMLENERKIDGLIREIERLRARQIHPDLAQTILDTQNILQDAARGGGTTLTNVFNDSSPLQQQQQQKKKRDVMFEGDDNKSSSSNNVSDIISSFVTHIQQLEDGAGDLIRKSSDMIARFETHLTSTRTTRANAATNELKQEMYELLDANAKIAVQIQQVIGDMKKGLRHISSSSSIITKNNVNHGGGSNDFHHHHHQSTESKVNSIVDSRQVSALRPYSNNNPSSTSNNNHHNRYITQPLSSHPYRSSSSSTSSSSSSRNQATNHYDDSNARDSPGEINIDDLRVDSYKSYSPGLSSTDYMISDNNTQQTPSIRQTTFSPTLLIHSKSNKLNVGNINNNNTLSSSISRHNDNIVTQSHVTSSGSNNNNNDLLKNDRLRKTSLYDSSSSSSKSSSHTINNNNNSNNTAAINSNSSSYTPSTATRISTNRLNKLGNDLEALAKKLDTFDTSRSR